MVQGNQSPVGDGTAHVASTHGVLTHDEVLAGCGVEELHIGGLKHKTLSWVDDDDKKIRIIMISMLSGTMRFLQAVELRSFTLGA